MRRLVSAFVVRKHRRQILSRRGHYATFFVLTSGNAFLKRNSIFQKPKWTFPMLNIHLGDRKRRVCVLRVSLLRSKTLSYDDRKRLFIINSVFVIVLYRCGNLRCKPHIPVEETRDLSSFLKQFKRWFEPLHALRL